MKRRLTITEDSLCLLLRHSIDIGKIIMWRSAPSFRCSLRKLHVVIVRSACNGDSQYTVFLLN